MVIQPRIPQFDGSSSAAGGLVRSDVQVLAGEAFDQRLVGGAEQAVDGVDAPGIRTYEDAGFVFQDAFHDDFRSLVRGGHGNLVEAFALGFAVFGFTHAGGVGDVGADSAGVYAADLHRLVFQFHFLAQGFGEAPNGKLGRVVGALLGHADQAKYAGDVHHMALTGFDQVGQEGAGAVGHAPEVDIHHPFEVFVGHLANGGRQRHAGVVDDQVNLAEVRPYLFGVGVDGFAVRDIEKVRTHVGTTAGGHGFRQPGFVNVRQRQPAAFGGQHTGKGPADSGTGSGYHSHFVLEILHDYDPLSCFCY